MSCNCESEHKSKIINECCDKCKTSKKPLRHLEHDMGWWAIICDDCYKKDKTYYDVNWK